MLKVSPKDESTLESLGNDEFTARVKEKLYSLLPLNGVATDCEGEVRCVGDTVRVRTSRSTRPYSDILADRLVTVPQSDEKTVEGVAAAAAGGILKKHPGGKWKAFVATVLVKEILIYGRWGLEVVFRVIYGLKENKNA